MEGFVSEIKLNQKTIYIINNAASINQSQLLYNSFDMIQKIRLRKLSIFIAVIKTNPGSWLDEPAVNQTQMQVSVVTA